MKKKSNYAFIDGNNLYLGAKSQKIDLNYGKLRKYLRDKLDVGQAFLFIGYDAQNSELYETLQKYGFVLIFKPTIAFIDETGNRTMKGNVDAELVLYTSAIKFDEYRQAVVVSSDGDFACLLKYLEEKKKLAKVITPTARYSKLLKPFCDKILPLKTIRKQVEGEK